MAYENPRPAKLLKAITGKVVGKNEHKEYKVGKACTVQRDPNDPGRFVIYFANNPSRGLAIFAKIPGEELRETIQYTDGRPDY